MRYWVILRRRVVISFYHDAAHAQNHCFLVVIPGFDRVSGPHDIGAESTQDLIFVELQIGERIVALERIGQVTHRTRTGERIAIVVEITLTGRRQRSPRVSLLSYRPGKPRRETKI